MRFIEKTNTVEMFKSANEALDNLYNIESKSLEHKLSKTIINLTAAANLIDDCGFEKEAAIISSIISKFSEVDPSVKNLTPEKMVENLKEKGWVFNADDGCVDDTPDEIEVEENIKVASTKEEVMILLNHKPLSKDDKKKIYDHLQHGWHNIYDYCGRIFLDPEGTSMGKIWGKFAYNFERNNVKDEEFKFQMDLLDKVRQRASQLGCGQKAFNNISNTYPPKTIIKGDPKEIYEMKEDI